MKKHRKGQIDKRRFFLIKTGGNYGYTFRVMPKNPMLLDAQNLNLIKWLEDEEKEEISEQDQKEVEEIVKNLEHI